MAEVRRSTIIDAPVDAVWRALRDFNGHADWHPIVAASEIEDGRAGDEVGAVRRFRLQDGAVLRELLLKHSDDERSFTYCILDSPIPLRGYVATVTLRPVTDGDRTFWDWRSRFEAPHELVRMVAEDVYEAGFAGLRAFLARGARPRAPAPRHAPLEGAAIVVRAHGGPETLRLERVAAPPPGPGEVRLRHTAIGVNYIDVYVRSGVYELLQPPGTPGMEAAGEILDVGEGVHGLRPGDRVAYAAPPVGAYAELRTMPATPLVPLPPEIDDATAAASMLKGMTAEYLLRRTHRVRRGETILVHSAAGGVGLFLCQWAKHLGARVIGTVSSEEKARIARAHGCDVPLVGDFVAPIREITGGRGVDVVYDAVGRATLDGSIEALAPLGHLVSYGQSSGELSPLDPARLGEKSLTFSHPVLFHYTADPARLAEMSRRLFDMIRSGAVRVAIGARWPLAAAADAHRALEARQTTGSTILLP
jgi:NADPH:quinone reductase-like Zn-dependent oxidoreductase